MALIWYEGYDEESGNAGTGIWGGIFTVANSNMQIQTTGGRSGSNFLFAQQQQAALITPVVYSSGCIGHAVKLLQYPSSAGILLHFSTSQTNLLVGAAINPNGTLQLGIGNPPSLIGSPTSFQYPLSQYHYIEVDAAGFGAGAGAGSATLYVDGSAVVTATGQTFGTQPNGFAVGSSANAYQVNFDDGYFLDHTGSAPYNAPLGDCAVVTEFTSASGDFTQWAIGGSAPKATNWQSVQETPPDGDVTFVSAASGASGAGLRDSYKYPTFPPAAFTNIGAILAVKVMGYEETDTAGLGQIEFSARQAGIDLFSPAFTLGVGYIYNQWITLVDVNGNAWTIPNLNATQFGIKRTA